MASDNTPKSLIDHFRHLDQKEQKQFLALLKEELNKGSLDLSEKEWEDLGLMGLTEEWDEPENEAWDEVFKNQKQ